MSFQEKILGQRRDNDTATHSVYSPDAKITGIIKNIMLCNTSSTQATVRVFIDTDGTTYDQSTAIMYDAPIPGNHTVEFCGIYALNEKTGSIGYQQGTANAITITVTGAEAK